MVLNKQKGNMYKWVTHTFNIIKGKCPHKCVYCYMKDIVKNNLYLDTKELKTDLGKGNTIFVGSSCDMFAEDVPLDWIHSALKYLFKFDNTYLFQSKNPKRFAEFALIFVNYQKDKLIFGTTIETDNEELIEKISNAPPICSRVDSMKEIKYLNLCSKYLVTIEPIMDFKVDCLVNIIKDINPDLVNIGADSKGSNLQEPNESKILELIGGLLEANIEVKIKDNLYRLVSKDKVDKLFNMKSNK